MSTWQVIQGNCVDVMRGMGANSVDSIVTDPPYGLEFMGKEWDNLTRTKWRNQTEADRAWQDSQQGSASINARRRNAPDYGQPGAAMQSWHYRWAIEALRVAKPGCIMLAFGGTRTFHRLACAIEDAGWEIRDTVMWVYGSGFPKSLDISKAIDKAAGAEREVVGHRRAGISARSREGEMVGGMAIESEKQSPITAPATDLARLWDGWGTALKPAWEPIIVAMKPLDGTFAQNAEKWGVAGLNIDGSRIPSEMLPEYVGGKPSEGWRMAFEGGITPAHSGRWPANLIHDGSHEAVACFPASSITGQRTARSKAAQVAGTQWLMDNHESQEYTDTGSAARFFYSAKASRAEREMGLEGMEMQPNGQQYGTIQNTPNPPQRNHHPTVKPLALMRYLVRLTKTPTGGLVLDPFMGSGTTGMACVMEGRDFVGIELQPEYVEIAKRRIAAVADL